MAVRDAGALVERGQTINLLKGECTFWRDISKCSRNAPLQTKVVYVLVKRVLLKQFVDIAPNLSIEATIITAQEVVKCNQSLKVLRSP